MSIKYLPKDNNVANRRLDDFEIEVFESAKTGIDLTCTHRCSTWRQVKLIDEIQVRISLLAVEVH